MKFKPGDRVLIDLDMLQTEYNGTNTSRCCGRRYDPDDLRTLLRFAAEGECRIAKHQIDMGICPYCGHFKPRLRGALTLEVLPPFLVGGIEWRYWGLPRSWLRLAEGGS